MINYVMLQAVKWFPLCTELSSSLAVFAGNANIQAPHRQCAAPRGFKFLIRDPEKHLLKLIPIQ